MDQAAADAAVAVAKGVDRLELDMRDRRLRDRRDVVAIHESAEVTQQWLNFLVGGADVFGVGRGAAPDPARLGADLAGDPVQRWDDRQLTVDLGDRVEVDGPRIGADLDSALQCPDRAHNLAGAVVALATFQLGFGEFAVGDAETLDLG